MRAKKIYEALDVLKPKEFSEIEKDVEKSKLSPAVLLDKSVESNFINGVKIALKKMRFFGDKQQHLNYALNQAALKNNIEIVKLLLDEGAAANSNRSYALRYAARDGYLDMVKLLVENGADVNAVHNLPLRNATRKGRKEIVEYLLKKGANPLPEDYLKDIL